MIATDARIFVAGQTGMVGSALVRCLRRRGYHRLILPSRSELDLRDQAAVQRFFASQPLEVVFLAAATVGGIAANAAKPAEFLYDNLIIAANVVHAAAAAAVGTLLFLGSSCIYPRLSPQPIREDDLLTGPLEPTNEGYAIAKIAGLKLCEMYRRQYGRRFLVAMPANLYGPGDNFHPRDSHVVAGLMRRFHEAKAAGAPSVAVWGTGQPRRELLHVDDLAEACIAIVTSYRGDGPVNVGAGHDCTVAELATTLAGVVGFRGAITFDPSMPDGTPRKLLDSGRISALGWRPQRPLPAGLAETYAWAQAAGRLDPHLPSGRSRP